MIKNIILLTKISTRNFLETFNIIDKEKKRINKKSIYVWLFLVVIIAITYLSNEILNFLEDYGQTHIFLDIIFGLVMIIMFMQTIIACMNILYFSKDLEYFLIFPIKSKELLLSRMQTMSNILYLTETIFLLVPLILYGTSTMASYLYYILIVPVLLLLPILPVALTSIIFLIIMNFMKKVKNRNGFQLITTIVFIGIIVLFEIFFIKGVLSNNINYEEVGVNFKTVFENINHSLIIVNPLIQILEQQDILINLLEVLGIYIIMYAILIFLGNKVYIKNILKTMEYYKSKKKTKIEIENACKLQSTSKTYIKNEFKNLFGNTTFFMQTIYPACITIMMLIILVLSFRFYVMEKNQELYILMADLKLTLEGVAIIAGITQILFSFSNISMTAISRQGKNAIFMKYIPVDIYKQFILKNVPQCIVNGLISIILLIAIKIMFISVTWREILCILPICITLGVLNSYIMLIVDTKRPILNWNSEIEIFKQNGNKIFQYIWTITIILLLMYTYNIFKNVNINIVMLIIFIFFTILLFILDRYVKKQIKKNKLFKKII